MRFGPETEERAGPLWLGRAAILAAIALAAVLLTLVLSADGPTVEPLAPTRASAPPVSRSRVDHPGVDLATAPRRPRDVEKDPDETPRQDRPSAGAVTPPKRVKLPHRVAEISQNAAFPPAQAAWKPRPRGRPAVSTARVTWRPGKSTRDSLLRVRVLAAESGTPLSPATVVLDPLRDKDWVLQTDDEGQVEHLVDAQADEKQFTLLVSAPGRVPRWVPDIEVGDGRQVVIDVSLALGVVAQGTVVDEGGFGLEGVSVLAYAHAAWWDTVPFGTMPRPVVEATTDVDGVYVLDALPRLKRLVVVATLDDRATATTALFTGADAGWPRLVDPLTCGEGTFVDGQITDVSGTPVQGASVYVVPFDGPPVRTRGALPQLVHSHRNEIYLLTETLVDARAEGRHVIPAYRAITDEDGRYVVRGLEEEVDHAAFALTRRRGRTPASLPFKSGRRHRYSAELRPRTRLQVRVIGPKGGPVHGVRITVPWMPNGEPFRSQGKGLYGPVEVDSGPHALMCVSRHHAGGLFAGVAEAGVLHTTKIRLEEGLSIQGMVRGKDDVPLLGASVSAQSKRTTTGRDGSFALHGLWTGVTTVTCSAPGHTETADLVDVPDAHVELDLAPTGRARIHLTLPEDADTPPWVRFDAGSMADPDRAGRVNGVPLDKDAGFQLDWAGGDLVFDRIPEGPSFVTVFVPGYVLIHRAFNCLAGEVVDLGEHPLLPWRGQRVRVLGPNDRVMSGATVCAYPATNDSNELRSRVLVPTIHTSDEHGLVSLPLPDGVTATLVAKVAGLFPAVLDVETRSDKVGGPLVLRRIVEVPIALRFEDGATPLSARAAYYWSGAETALAGSGFAGTSWRADSTGFVRLRGPPPPYRIDVTARHPNGRWVETSFEVGEDETYTFELDVPD